MYSPSILSKLFTLAPWIIGLVSIFTTSSFAQAIDLNAPLPGLPSISSQLTSPLKQGSPLLGGGTPLGGIPGIENLESLKGTLEDFTAVPTTDSKTHDTLKETKGILSSEWWIENGIKPAIRQAVRGLIKGATAGIVDAIRGNPSKIGFFDNIGNELHRRMDVVGGNLLNKISGRNLCGNIGGFLNFALRTTPYPEEQFDCSVTDIVDNLGSFYANFEKGGWETFLKVSLEPQNNPIGAYWLAWDAIGQAQLLEKETTQNTFLANRGTLGYEEIECESVQDLAREGAYQQTQQDLKRGFVGAPTSLAGGMEILTVQKGDYNTDDGCPPKMIARNIVTKTPGGLFVDMLSKNLSQNDTDFFMANADDVTFLRAAVDAAMGDIITAATERLADLTGLGGFFGNPKKKLPDNPAYQPPPGAPPRQPDTLTRAVTTTIQTQSSQTLANVTRLVALVNKELAAKSATLFDKERQLALLTKTFATASADAAAANQTITLKKEIADLKDLIQRGEKGKNALVQKFKTVHDIEIGALLDRSLVLATVNDLNGIRDDLTGSVLSEESRREIEKSTASASARSATAAAVERYRGATEAAESSLGLVGVLKTELEKRLSTLEGQEKASGTQMLKILTPYESRITSSVGLLRIVESELPYDRIIETERRTSALNEAIDLMVQIEADTRSALQLLNVIPH